jgi:hypothetical protein
MWVNPGYTQGIFMGVGLANNRCSCQLKSEHCLGILGGIPARMKFRACRCADSRCIKQIFHPNRDAKQRQVIYVGWVLG